MHTPADGTGQPIPRTIFALWLAGWDDAPEIVRACRATWEKLNPGWTYRALTRTSLAALLDARTMKTIFPATPIPPQRSADIARVELLLRYGGVWADATTYCLQPLDAWLPHAAPLGFFAFAKPGPDRMLSTWFLAAAPGNPLLARWAAFMRAFWSGRTEPEPYFWLHYVFADGYRADPVLRELWDATPEMRADAPHTYLPYDRTMYAPATERDRMLLDEPFAPMLKLTHKLPPGPYPDRSVIRLLCDRAFAPAAGPPS